MTYRFAPRAAVYLLFAVFLAACGQPKIDTGIALPETESRLFRYLRLDNRMQVVLISDPAADKAAAALDVNIGSRQDPRDRQGLAHFLEHMLFLGTEKYPEPGEYQAFIAAHGGSHNAYTSFEHTNYFFDVNAAYLEEGLDRFAQFFVAPLFNPPFVQREVNAVDSEYQARIQNDHRRALDVFKELANPEHPLSKFTVGNLSTLLGGRGEEALREALLEFYAEYYSANRMSLVVIGRESLDALQTMVESRFAAVPDHNVKTRPIDEPLVDNTPLRFELKPRQELRELSINFEMPDLRSRYREKPLHFVGHILGHEGQGSLLQALKERGWAEGLRAGGGVEFQGGSLFSIDIELTPDGLANVDAVTDAVFEAIALLREEGLQAWRYQELSDIGRQQFAYRTRPEEAREASHLARNLQYYAPADLIRGDYELSEFDAEHIRELLQGMTAERAIISITHPEAEAERESQLYNVPYRRLPVSAESLARWRDRDGFAGLALPEPNPFIASRLSLKSSSGADRPKQIMNSGRVSLWHLRDERFDIPKGNLDILVRSPEASTNARQQAATELWLRMVRDELNAYTYPAQLAGLNYSLGARWDGVGLEIRGFDDKQAELLESVAGGLGSPVRDETRFERIKAEYIRDLENQQREEPYRQLFGALTTTLERYRWPVEARLEAARSISLEQLRAHADALLSATELYIQAHGNYSEDDAREFARIASGYLLGARLADAQPEQILRIPKGESGTSLDIDHRDAGLMWYLQAPRPGHRARIVMGIAGQMLGSDFFHQLRTEKQLGYVVTAGAFPRREVAGLYFLVQSPVADTATLQAEFTGFLREWLNDKVDASLFQQHKQALREKLLEAPHNLWDAGDRFWRDLMDGYAGFDSREQLVAVLDHTGYQFWRDELGRYLDSGEWRSLWIQAGGRWGEQPLGTRPISGPATVGTKRQYFLYSHVNEDL